MAVSVEEVKRIAALARLELSNEESSRLAEEMSRILAFAESIRGLETTDVPPTTHAVEITDVMREDIAGPMLDRDLVLKSAPAAESGCFFAPRIV